MISIFTVLLSILIISPALARIDDKNNSQSIQFISGSFWIKTSDGSVYGESSVDGCTVSIPSATYINPMRTWERIGRLDVTAPRHVIQYFIANGSANTPLLSENVDFSF